MLCITNLKCTYLSISLQLRSCSHEFDSDPAPLASSPCQITDVICFKTKHASWQWQETGGMYRCSAGVLCALPSGVQHRLEENSGIPYLSYEYYLILYLKWLIFGENAPDPCIVMHHPWKTSTPSNKSVQTCPRDRIFWNIISSKIKFLHIFKHAL